MALTSDYYQQVRSMLDQSANGMASVVEWYERLTPYERLKCYDAISLLVEHGTSSARIVRNHLISRDLHVPR